MTSYIPLTQGLHAAVDDEDYERCMQHKWFAHRSREQWYAETKIGGVTVKLHRFILGLGPGDPEIDHKDVNGLNNRTSNMRLDTTGFVNAGNKGPRKDNTTGVAGVYYSVTGRGRKYWHAQITRAGKQKLIGRYLTFTEAVAARQQAEIEDGL